MKCGRRLSRSCRRTRWQPNGCRERGISASDDFLDEIDRRLEANLFEEGTVVTPEEFEKSGPPGMSVGHSW